ncbi:MAG: hypothetical protein A2586_00470 [Candidatus Harrisonbacteria bacterium RIFOXYD1_FULL_40_9]|uniref:Small ribosomal subunit protein uS4 n=1 Tax=Candidatus Harrisonbacteria bacterium RIFOXYD1_FULL_40_9 TaxID=1798412 RepID=A0A1G1ZYZ1_9BACT|nr:MAG: hypothetical protein A2586_00470 [Candidatus Harrisonbacteria bacterium RIFOXYD1_FULL_40_9]
MNIKEKKERALGVRLFLKAHRCNSPKCALARKPFAPGIFGKKRKRALSEMGTELREKQKVKFSYSLNEAQLKRIFTAALKSPEATNELMIQLLERRLDNVVFRLGFAESRASARQLVRHGHIIVNGHKVTAPAYMAEIGDVLTFRPESKTLQVFKNAEVSIEKAESLEWLTVNPKEMKGTVKTLPSGIEVPFNMSLLVEYYSK